MPIRRRDLLASTAFLLLSAPLARAQLISGTLPWEPYAGDPPVPVLPGPWRYFTAAEGRAVEAIADRIIPPDPETPGGKDAGCAAFIDSQLAGPYGHNTGHYNQPPFQK
jgi:gluconate 2-dehydrogenase gamma chain